MEEEIKDNGIQTGYLERVDPPRGYGSQLRPIINFEKDKINENVEYFCSSDLKGNSFGISTQMHKSSVYIDSNIEQELYKDFKLNGPYNIVGSHNHPNHSAFSDTDINTFIARNFEIELRACGKFYTHVVQKPKNRLNNLKVRDQFFNDFVCNPDPNVTVRLERVWRSQEMYWYRRWRQLGEKSGIKLNPKFENDPEYSIFMETSHKAIKQICETYGILYSRYETESGENVENQEIKDNKVDIDETDINSLSEMNNIVKIEPKKVVIDDRYDILTPLDTRDLDYELTMFRRPYPFEDYSSFNKKKIQEKKEEYEKNGIDEKTKTIIETRNLTVRRKAKIKGAADIVGGITQRKDYSYIPIGRTFGMGGYGLTVFGGTGTNAPYTGGRTKSGKLQYDKATESNNGWGVLPKEIQSQYMVSERIPGLKPYITCRKEVLPILYNLMYDLHKSVEPMVSTSCFNFRKIRDGSTTWSCHASGTAIDYNHRKHPHHKANTFNSTQVAQIQKLIKRYGCRWGGNYGGTSVDDMHFEVWMTETETQLHIQKLNLVDRMNKIKSGINVPVEV